MVAGNAFVVGNGLHLVEVAFGGVVCVDEQTAGTALRKNRRSSTVAGPMRIWGQSLKRFFQRPRRISVIGASSTVFPDPRKTPFLARRGFAIGVDGPVTYPKNDQLREAVKLVGLPGLVLETDSPYLPPQSARGQRNDPAAIPEIALGVARTLGLSLEEVADGALTRNALDLYRC